MNRRIGSDARRRHIEEALWELERDSSPKGRSLLAAALMLSSARALLETGQAQAARDKLRQVGALLRELEPAAQPDETVERTLDLEPRTLAVNAQPQKVVSRG